MKNELRELLWNICRCEGDTARNAVETENFHDLGRPNDGADSVQEFKEPRDNEVYNYGVINGSLALLDQLFAKGYKLFDPMGQPITLAEGQTITATFGEGKWVAPVSDCTCVGANHPQWRQQFWLAQYKAAIQMHVKEKNVQSGTYYDDQLTAYLTITRYTDAEVYATYDVSDKQGNAVVIDVLNPYLNEWQYRFAALHKNGRQVTVDTVEAVEVLTDVFPAFAKYMQTLWNK